MPIQSQNPATGEIVKTFSELTDSEIETKLSLADKTFQTWKLTSFAERKTLILKLATLYKDQASELAKLPTLEMGKIIRESEAEVKKCAWAMEYYAENAEKFLTPEIIKTDASESYISFEPLGTILAVMPWNFPYWQVIRALSALLMAGNTLILKHASNVPQVALKIEELCLEAGIPEGVFQTLLISSDKVELLINDPRIKGVTLTGSETAGSLVAAAAGRNIKPAVIELGGSDPFIVYPDVDLDSVVSNATISRLQNNGQVCNAAKRFIVHSAIYDQFVSVLKVKFENIVIGDPSDSKTDLGPLVNQAAFTELSRQLEAAKKLGAKMVTGGPDLERNGWYFRPTILTNITTDMPIYFEETFGPIAAIYKFDTDEEMLKIANATNFGLGASIWTNDLAKAKSLISQLEAGSVFVNKMVATTPYLPFGGVKHSGIGRELSEYGIKEFMNIKTVYVQ